MFEADINCRADLVEWLNRLLDALDGPDATAISRDCWIDAWRDAIGYARALGLRDKLEPFGEPMQQPTYVIDYEVLQKEIRDELRGRVANLLHNLGINESAKQRTADKKTDDGKKLPPNHVNDCARYIVAQWKLIADGKRPRASKKALIAEFLPSGDTAAMQRELQPSRYGWLLDINGQTDK